MATRIGRFAMSSSVAMTSSSSNSSGSSTGAGVALLALALVGDQQHRLVGAAREIGKGAIVRREPRARVDHEHQRVGEADRRLGLLLHPRGQRALGALVEARGVDDGEFEIAKTPLAFAAVARDTGFVIDQ